MSALPAGTIRCHEPPCVPAETPFVPGKELRLAPGVLGYAIAHMGRIFIPIIIAEREGSGDIGRFLDSLSPRCVVVGVLSPRLAGMLVRRGWEPRIEPDYYGEPCDVWAAPGARRPS